MGASHLGVGRMTVFDLLVQGLFGLLAMLLLGWLFGWPGVLVIAVPLLGFWAWNLVL
jgi:hypothetical protein